MTTKGRKAFAGVLLLVAIGLLAVLRKGAITDSSAAEKRHESELAKLNQELQETRETVKSLERAQMGVRLAMVAPQQAGGVTEESKGSSRTEAPEELDESDEAALEEKLAQERAAVNARHSRLNDELRRERRDVVWARQAEEHFKEQIQRFSAPEFTSKPEIVALECAASLCRMELKFGSEVDSQRFRITPDPSIRRSTTHLVAQDGDYKSVTFFARGDRSLHPVGRPETLAER